MMMIRCSAMASSCPPSAGPGLSRPSPRPPLRAAPWARPGLSDDPAQGQPGGIRLPAICHRPPVSLAARHSPFFAVAGCARRRPSHRSAPGRPPPCHRPPLPLAARAPWPRGTDPAKAAPSQPGAGASRVLSAFEAWPQHLYGYLWPSLSWLSWAHSPEWSSPRSGTVVWKNAAGYVKAIGYAKPRPGKT